MAPEEIFSSALERLSSRADWLLKETEVWASPHELRFVSQGQAKPAIDAFYKWIKAGSIGQQPLSKAQFKTTLYDLSRIGREVSSFPTVSCLAVRDLTVQLSAGVQRKSGLTTMGSIRGVLERIALATWLSNKTSSFDNIDRPTFENLMMDYAEPITRALHGTGLAWMTFAGSDLRAVKAKDAAYKRGEASANKERVQILSAIDGVDKRIPGTRVAYEILCDFLHPNVGDLYSATTSAASLTDQGGTRHLVRRLGPPEALFLGAPDLQTIMAQVFDIFGEVTETYCIATRKKSAPNTGSSALRGRK